MEKIAKEDVIDFLSKYFKNYYDVTPYDNEMQTLPVMRCDMHASNQKFFLFKSAVIWEANCHEYVYVFKVERLSLPLYKQLESYVLEEGMKLIKPNKNHMYSYLTLFVVCESADKEALMALKKCNYRKDFKFSFHGWTELHTVSYICDPNEFITNRTGREYKKLLRDISNYCKH